MSFSKFSWALALFCLPSALWPLALLVSPKFSNHPNLTSAQIEGFSILFWTYPAILLLIASLLYKLHQSHRTLANGLLLAAFTLFYSGFGYVLSVLGA